MKNTIILILSVLVIGLGSYLIFDKVIDKSKEKNNSNDSEDIRKAYDLLGIDWDKSQSDGDCLNYFISSNNYKSNAQKIFSLYANHKNMREYMYDNGKCGDECQMALSCADCATISKENAQKVMYLYSFDSLSLSELPGVETNYAYNTGTPTGMCHYEVKHDIKVNSENDNVVIVDNQIVTDFAFGTDNNVSTTKDQKVTYYLEKDENQNYVLSNVVVE